ncbi:MAG: ATP-binding protein [Syntrophobacteraceae bacterium]
MNSEVKTSLEPANCILREQVRLALDQVPTMQAISLIVSLVLCYAVRNEVSPGNLAVWGLLIVSAVTGGTILYYRFDRVKKERFNAAVWRNIYLATIIISGTFWGLSAFVLLPDGYSPFLSAFIFVLVSLSAAAAISHASIKFGSIAWAAPALLPFALRFFLQMTESGVVTSFLILLFLYGLYRISLTHQHSIASGIALRFQNQELVAELQEANEQLRRDILERKRSEEALIWVKESLKRAGEELERRVQSRTGDLSIAKEQLEAEICERRRIEEKLRRESAFRETVILNAKEGMSVWRPIEEYPYIRFTVWNRAMEKITGYTMEEINRLGWAQAMHDDPAMQAYALEIMGEVLAKDELSRLERSIKRADGQMRDVIISLSPVRPPGEQAYVIALLYDFTELKRAENGLRQSEAQFRGLMENIGVGILIVQDGRIVYRNAEQANLSGSLISESDRLEDLAQNIHSDDRHLLKALLACSGTSVETPMEVVLRFLSQGVGKSPGTRWVSCRCGSIEYQGRPARLIHMIDISELKKLERLMMLREKMVSLGHVAAGIAHEIRNPLSGINVYLDAIRECYQDPEYSEDVSRLVEEAQGASNRIESVIKRVLDFSRPTEVNMRPTSINETIGDALKLVAVSLRKAGIVLELDLAADLPQIFADSQLLEQLILNLVTNAAEVLKGVADKRLIRIATRMENGHVSIRVEDSGPGIPKEMREEVFEPFFTTRGQGMGIGLVICKRIAADHGGEITLTTSALGGARFNIMIPVEKRKIPR